MHAGVDQFKFSCYWVVVIIAGTCIKCSGFTFFIYHCSVVVVFPVCLFCVYSVMLRSVLLCLCFVFLFYGSLWSELKLIDWRLKLNMSCDLCYFCRSTWAAVCLSCEYGLVWWKFLELNTIFIMLVHDWWEFGYEISMNDGDRVIP